MEALGAEQRVAVGRHRHRGRDDRAVGHDPPGVTSRSWRSRRASPTARGPRRAVGVRAPGAAPTYGARARRARRAEAEQRSNSSRAHSSLPAAQFGGQVVAELDQHLDVEGGVLQPRLGQRTGRPVGGGVLLAHAASRAGSRRAWRGRRGGSRAGGRPARCRTGRRTQAHLGQAREVLGRGVQDPLGAVEGVGSGARVSKAIGSTSRVPEPSRRSWIR